MNTSTVDDIVSNHKALMKRANELLHKHWWSGESDWWETVDIGGYQFDLNIFDWEAEDGEPMVVVTAHPVEFDQDGYGSANMSKFVRLLSYQNGKVTEIGVR